MVTALAKGNQSSAKCPRCAGRLLEPCTVAHQEVDICPKCAGLWCEPTDWDSNTLGAFPSKASLAGQPADLLIGDSGPPLTVTVNERPGYRCPHCHATLRAIRIGDLEPLELDQCSKCGGVWFDSGEWRHLESLRTYDVHRLDPALAAPTTWRQWAIQFFIGLPFEFNVAPRRPPVVTYSIIAICFFVFLMQLALPEEWWLPFAARPADIWQGYSLYTLITSSFLHGSLLHLVGNMYFLYLIGDNIEDALGWLRYLALYLFSGVVGDLAHVAVFAESQDPLIGASGAIFGLMAAYLLLYPTARLTMILIVWQVKLPFWAWMGIYLLIQLIGSYAAWYGHDGGIAYWDHLGGFAAGLIFIAPMTRSIIQSDPLLRLLHRFGIGKKKRVVRS